MCSNVSIRYKINIILLILFFILTFPSNIYASILINEVSPKTDPEWVKLYNDGDTDVDLTGYLLKDGNSLDDDLTLSGTILSHGYLTFNHNKGWLNDGGDTIKLYDNATPSASIIAEYTYPTPSPVPTPAPATVAPTSAPTTSPTKSSTPTSVPTVKPTPAKTASPKPSSTPNPTEESEENSSIETATSLINPTTTPIGIVAGATTENLSAQAGKSPLLSIILVLGGVACLGYVGYLIYNQRHVKKEINN